jgi:DNA-binding response OmpR family regulator
MKAEKKTKIIYVEDDQDTINLVSLIFSRHGYDLIGITESQKGLELIEHEKPDIVMLDLMLPEMDGWEVFRKLKKNPKTAKIPVIIITAKAQPIDKVLGLQIAKVDDYICKPFTPEEILASVNKILKK